jgi:hydrogenase maturation factor
MQLCGRMHVLAVEHGNAICDMAGIRANVSLFLLPHETVAPGCWVDVDHGFALSLLEDPHESVACDGPTQDQRLY